MKNSKPYNKEIQFNLDYYNLIYSNLLFNSLKGEIKK